MDLSDFAAQILFGERIEDKLVRVDAFADVKRRAMEIPSVPGRPVNLRWSNLQKQQKFTFPSLRELESDRGRGTAFHYFANHELLALELMAVALLRFPDASPQFRAHIAGVMREEQEHLAAYLEQMQRYGVGFGDVPVSPFFWNALAGMSSPLEYVAGMSLTLEQANLDFASYYRDVFAKLGDEVGAGVLEKVLDDEIGHVKLGVTWLRRWSADGEDPLQAHENALRLPLSLARAKGGVIFDVASRLRTGLSPEYIERLRLHQASKGRAPTLWVFNPGCELEMAGQPASRVASIAKDLGFCMTYLAATDDVVSLPALPRTEFLSSLADIGWSVSEYVEQPSGNSWSSSALWHPRLAGICPWGWTRAMKESLEKLAQRYVFSIPVTETLERRTLISTKTHAAKLGDEFLRHLDGEFGDRVTQLGWNISSWTAAEEILDGYAHEFANGAVLKLPLGTAGRGALLIGPDAPNEHQRRWITSQLSLYGELRLEPWALRRFDLSARFEVDIESRLRLRGLTRFLTDRRGGFLGVILAPLARGLVDEDMQFVYAGGKDPRWIERLYRRMGAWLLTRPEFENYRGPFGIDGMVYQTMTGGEFELRLRPLVEINARYTMGHVADALLKKVHRSSCGIWLHVSSRWLRETGYDSLRAFARDYPTQVRFAGTQSRGTIATGRVWTSDPETATQIATVLVVGSDFDAALRMLGPVAAAINGRVCDVGFGLGDEGKT